MASVSLKQVHKTFPNGFEAVKNIDLDVEDGEFVVFVGPSGCGKSTIIRMVAGQEMVTSGEIKINGKQLKEINPKELSMAMVLQNYALYPKLTVEENLAFGLEKRGYPKEEIEARSREVAADLHLADIYNKKPKSLSASQRQRVALGRALILKPDLLILDEPLAGLEKEIRESVVQSMAKKHAEIKNTILYVTHSVKEAKILASQIVVMKRGEVIQKGTYKELYYKPENAFVAEFINEPDINLIDGQYEVLEGRAYITTELGEFYIKLEQKEMEEIHKRKREVIVGIRPEDITLGKGREKDSVRFSKRIEGVLKEEESTLLTMRVANRSFNTLMRGEYKGKADAVEEFCVETDRIYVFDRKTKELILAESKLNIKPNQYCWKS
ncbi:multiple sugar transport system ATP-binding protein [Aequitasia blattaphilus]|uniref:ABC transporter ATP-binding protein n=1 Tax=Aequitasia blattaphilus TaxID=2949332 RepID=A0ABT1ECA6_9FIRM|nr:ABC transporter ATP-binding protein [Aequitasia blattaphilus]MCP1102471.1 ABC transporter ATP-binding protein [Aequitasia blattaphilus]MCR8615111.1 ABC transporter ATP-binding protein [Aequitasia blattaphilus]